MILCVMFALLGAGAASASAGPADAPPAAEIARTLPAPAPQTDEQQIAALIAQQFAAWNARDLDGYLAPCWRSPLLIYAVDGSVWTGWDEVRARVARDYPDPAAMGKPVLERLQTNVLSPEMATTLEWWTVYFPGSKVRGFTTSAWRKVPGEGWRIVVVHTNTAEPP